MRQDTVITDRSILSDAKLLRWLKSLRGVDADRLHDGLLVDDSGRAVPLSLEYTEAAWTAHPRTGRLLSLDVGAESIYGHSILDLRRRPALLFEAILPEDRGVLRELIAVCVQGGDVSRRFRIRAADGRLKWLMAHAAMVFDAEGRAMRVEGLLRDVTDEIEREQDAEHSWRRHLRQREAVELMFHDEVLNRGDLDEALERLGVLAAEALEVDRVSFWFGDVASGDLRCRVLMTQDGPRPCDALLSRDANRGYFDLVTSAKLVAVNDVAADARAASLRDPYLDGCGVRACVDAVVLKGGEFVGLVKVEHVGRTNGWRPEERRFVGRLASQVTHVLERLERESSERERRSHLEQLHEERRRLRTLMASLPGMAFRIRNAENWPVEFISEGCVDLIGWRPDEIIDNRVVSHAQCVHPDDIGKVWECMNEALTSGRPYEIEYRIVDKSGRAKWVWEQGLGVHENGELVAAEGFVCDISDRVEAMKALRESEMLSRELIDNMHVGVAVLEATGEPVEFVVKDFNKAAETIEGLRREDILGRSILDAAPHLAGTKLQEFLRGVLETGRPLAATSHLKVDDGRGRWYDYYIYRLQTGDLVFVFEDITRRRLTEQDLTLKQISIDQANDAMIWTDVDGRLIDANERAGELYGYGRESLLGKSVFDITRDHTDETWRRRWDMLTDVGSTRHEAVHVREDGTEVPVEVSTRSLAVGGREIHCTIVRDMTEQKRFEEKIRRMNDDLEQRVQERTQDLEESQEQLLESEKMAALGRLVASVTHEINTPIGIGVTAASHLRDKLGSTKSRYEEGLMKRSDFEHFLADSDDISRMILSNLDKAARLIQGFKGVAVDQSDEARRTFDLAAYLEEIMLSLRPRFKRTRIAIDVDCPAGVVVDSYPGALSQVVTNLMMNSLIHGFVGSGAGRIAVEASVEDGQVRFRLSDDGVGMSDDVRRKIFEPFFTTKRGQGGSGLGMHVVYTAVTESLGGSIACESSLGGGTSFLIDFPLVRGGDDE